MNISVGIKRELSGFRFAKGELGQRVQRGLEVVGRYILRESQKIVPIDTKKLHDSGFTGISSGGGFSTVVVVGYDTPYAKFVHEDKPGKYSPLRHGSDYNAYYASHIGAGLTHARRPDEKAYFLTSIVQTQISSIKGIFVTAVTL